MDFLSRRRVVISKTSYRDRTEAVPYKSRRDRKIEWSPESNKGAVVSEASRKLFLVQPYTMQFKKPCIGAVRPCWWKKYRYIGFKRSWWEQRLKDAYYTTTRARYPTLPQTTTPRTRRTTISQICIINEEKQLFCTLCTCIFRFCAFHSRSRSIHDVK